MHIRHFYYVLVHELREFYLCRFLNNLVMRHCQIVTLFFVETFDDILDCKILKQSFLILFENLVKTLDWFPRTMPICTCTYYFAHNIPEFRGLESMRLRLRAAFLEQCCLKLVLFTCQYQRFFAMWILPVLLLISCFYIF